MAVCTADCCSHAMTRTEPKHVLDQQAGTVGHSSGSDQKNIIVVASLLCYRSYILRYHTISSRTHLYALMLAHIKAVFRCLWDSALRLQSS